VIGYNTQKLKPEEVPARWRDITNIRWNGQLGIADPRFGTTRGHFAAMYALWGEADYVKFLGELKEVTGVRLLDGNATSAALVARGELHLGATDTDDVYARQARAEPIDLTYPDMGDGGTLLIPNSVALVSKAPHPETAKTLIDFLTSEVTERLLAQSDSRNIPVRVSLRQELKLTLPSESALGYVQIAGAMNRAIALAGEHLID
jgi:iron(III) transport system substrate-binding protein